MKITSHHTILTFEISITKSNCDMVFLPMNHCAIYRYRKTVIGFEYNIIYKFEIFTKRFYHIISGSFFCAVYFGKILEKIDVSVSKTKIFRFRDKRIQNGNQ